MADSETPVLATDFPVDIQVEIKEPQQELKSEHKLQEQAATQEETTDTKQEETVKLEQEETAGVSQGKSEPEAAVKLEQEETVKTEQEETVNVEQEKIVGVKEDESASAKQDSSVDIKQEHGIKQEEEVVTDVKREAEIKDEAAVDVTTEGSKATTDKKTTGDGCKWRPHVSRSKFDPTVLPDSDDPEEIRKQVEFYFSESNLSSDKFLFSLTGGKENKPVPLNLIVSFKRMKRFPNKGIIIDALKESTLIELGGDPGEETIKRKIPVKIAELMSEDRRFGAGGGYAWSKNMVDFEPNQDPTIHRSIYAKGFGEETATTQIDIEKFFEPHGQINAVRLRRDLTKNFKKSVFVEFATDELAQNFMALEKKPVWKGKELMWLSKLAYVQGKVQDIKDGKIQPKVRPDIRHQRGGNHNGANHNGANHNGANHNGANHNGANHKHNGNRNNDRNSRGGSRGRGGRGRGRGGHSNDRRGGGDRDNKKRGDREGFKKEDNGIPKIKSSAEAVKSEPTNASTQNGASKRKATDEGASEVKKPKVGETVT